MADSEPTDVGSIVGHLKLDIDNWKSNIREAEADLERLKASRVDVRVGLDTIEALRQMDEFKVKLDDLDTRRVDIPVRINTAEFEAQLAALKAQLDALKAEIKVGGGSGGGGGGSSDSGPSVLGSAAALAGPAAVPLAATAAAGAGAAVLLLGSLAAGIKGVSVEESLGTATGKAYQAGVSTLKDELAQLERTAASGLLTPFQTAVAQSKTLLPGLNSEVLQFSRIAGTDATSALHGLAGGFTTLRPLLTDLALDSEKLFKSFDQYANGTGLQKFESWVQANLPGVERDIEDVAGAAGKVIAAIAPMGVTSLNSIGLLARAIDSLPISVLQVAVPLLTDTYVAIQSFKLINTAVGGINNFTAAIKAMRAGGEGASLSLAGILGPVGAVAVGVGLLTSQFFSNNKASQEVAQAADSYADALDKDSGAIGSYTRAQIAKNLADSGALQAAQKLGVSAATVTDAVSGNAAAMSQVKTAVGAADAAYTQANHSVRTYVNASGSVVTSSKGASQAQKDQKSAADSLSKSLNTQSNGLADQVTKWQLQTAAARGGTEATGAADAATQALAKSMGLTTDAYLAAKQSADQNKASTDATTASMRLENDAAGLLKASLDALNGTNLSVQQSQTAFDSATLSLQSTLKQNGSAINDTTAAGVANRQAIEGAVSAAQNYAEALAKTTGSSAQAQAQYAKSAQALLDTIAATDGDRTAADRAKDATYQYAQQLLGLSQIKVPPTKIDVDKAAADAKIAALQKTVSTFPGLNVKVSLANYAAVQAQIANLTATRTEKIVIQQFSASQVRDTGPTGGHLIPTSAAGTDYVRGPGTTTSDSIPYMLSLGEAVINAAGNAANPGIAALMNSGQSVMQALRQQMPSPTSSGLYGPPPPSAALASAGAAQAAAGRQSVQIVQVPVPTELVVQDVNGALIGRMKVEANRAVDANNTALLHATRY